jgi:hypothetical protein
MESMSTQAVLAVGRPWYALAPTFLDLPGGALSIDGSAHRGDFARAGILMV